MGNPRIVGFLILLLATVTLALPVHAQDVCKVVNYSTAYPKTATVGEAITVSTRITFYCAQSEDSSWMVRVELTEPITGSIVSTGLNNVTSSSPSVTLTVSNMLQAPERAGTWFLRLHIYVTGQHSHKIVATDNGSISIQLQQASTTMASVTSATSTTSTTSTRSTEEVKSYTTSTSSTSTGKGESLTSTRMVTQPAASGIFLGESLLTAIFLIAAAVMMLSRHMRAR